MAVCIKCSVDKPTDQFYAHPQMAAGHLGVCKECHKERIRENRAENADYYRAYDRKRYREQEHRKENARLCAATPAAQERRKIRNKERREEAPEKFRARSAVANAIRTGKITKADACYFCGTGDKLQAHHHDYSHPLDVVWLCAACHGKLHTINGDLRRSG